MAHKRTQLATFAGGCFWCTEAIFQRIRGVHRVVSGYTGGNTAQPTFEQLHTKKTGHAEAIQIEFDSSIITYEQLLEIFLGTHDPTTINRQGNDIGEEYRSVIYYHTDDQQHIAEEVKNRIDRDHVYDQPIMTEILPASMFYPAENEHQDFYARNPEQPYCRLVISPKLTQLRKKFASYLSPE